MNHKIVSCLSPATKDLSSGDPIHEGVVETGPTCLDATVISFDIEAYRSEVLGNGSFLKLQGIKLKLIDIQHAGIFLGFGGVTEHIYFLWNTDKLETEDVLRSLMQQAMSILADEDNSIYKEQSTLRVVEALGVILKIFRNMNIEHEIVSEIKEAMVKISTSSRMISVSVMAQAALREWIDFETPSLSIVQIGQTIDYKDLPEFAATVLRDPTSASWPKPSSLLEIDPALAERVNDFLRRLS